MKKINLIKIFKESVAATLVVSISLALGYLAYEPQVLNAAEDTTQVSLTVTGEININCSSAATLSPNILGQSGGTATGTFSCLVETNDTGGYYLTLKKDQLLLTGSGGDNSQFNDYVTSTTATDWAWDTTVAGDERFGFCVDGAASTTDIIAKYRDNGLDTCATGDSVSSQRCWHPIPTNPTEEQIANRSLATPSGGILIEIGLRAEVGGSNNLTSGTYNCTTTATALVNP